MKKSILFIWSIVLVVSWQLNSLDSFVIEMPLLSKDSLTTQTTASLSNANLELPKIVSYQPEITSNSLYNWQTVEKDQHKEFNRVLAYELAKYPDDFFKRAEINNIYIVDEIRGQNSAFGFADTATRDIYLNVTSGNDLSNPYILSTIHHEIAHLYFIELAGYAVINDDYWQSIYSSVNSNGFSGIFPDEGFVSKNATLSVAEDMAEVFAFMMSDEYRYELNEKRSSDSILDKKVEYILRLNSRFYPDSDWLFPA